MRYFWILTILGGFIFYTPKYHRHYPKAIIFNKVLLTDSFPSPKPYSEIDIHFERYHPLYMGNATDTISLSYNHARTIRQNATENYYLQEATNKNLSITVDTSRLLITEDGFPSYPVILENFGRDTVMVGINDLVFLRLEAQDSTGKWRAIQNPFISICGNGAQIRYLATSQIAITSCTLLQGDYRTKMRLAYGQDLRRFESTPYTAYSNEFTGNMEYRQFHHPRLENLRQWDNEYNIYYAEEEEVSPDESPRYKHLGSRLLRFLGY